MKALTINHREIGVQELVQRVKFSGRDTVIKSLVIQTILEQYALENNLVVTEEELQQRFDALRRRRGLFSAAATEQWLKENGITLDDLEKDFEIRVLSEKIRDSSTRETVEKFFAENKANMDTAEISMLTVKEPEVAMELLAQIREDGAEFMVLAGEYSIDERAKYSGYVGIVERQSLVGEVSAAIFQAKAGEVVGPFQTDMGYNLVQVKGLYPAVLDEQKEREIRNILFQRFLGEEEQKARILWAI